MKKALVFGAGNIGRGFIGQLLCESGYEVSFADLDELLIDTLNKRGSYHLRTVFNDDAKDYEVGPVKALHAVKDAAKIAETLAEAEIACTSVGAGALKYLVPNVLAGLELRAAKGASMPPLNIILCENLHGASGVFRALLKERMRPELNGWFDANVGLVDTVIGRMVPAPTPEMRAADPSFIQTEPYKELPVDKSAFKGAISEIVAMTAYDSFEVFTARKLYLHNCGHAILAYLGALRGHESSVDALNDPFVSKAMRAALSESVKGIVAKFKADPAWLNGHVDELMRRFANRPLGDNVARLGRDPLRKLQPEDRLVGAARLAAEAGVVPEHLAFGIASAFLFDRADDPSAPTLKSRIAIEGFAAVMKSVCGIDATEPLGHLVLDAFGRLEEMARPSKRAVVAGHICLDVIPQIGHHFELTPGRLFEVGASAMSTGGAVSNTGLAMRILGQPVTLVGRVGSDDFGAAVTSLLKKYGDGVADGIVSSPGDVTSYSIVVSIPGQDRIFLHCPGSNHKFDSSDVKECNLSGASLFHFGYPPIMERMYADCGAELEKVMRKAKDAGLTTSMDMVTPDPDAPSGKADWPAIFRRVLPLLDVFLPSADELLYVFDRENFGKGDTLDAQKLSQLADRMIEEGVAIAGIKLGARGLYLKTASAERLAAAGRARPADLAGWASRELWFPTYSVPSFAGATGAGDSTIAGFLSALMRGCSVEDAGRFANAVGACNVEAPDALSGLKDWRTTWRRLLDSWSQNELDIRVEGWWRDAASGVWHGPADNPTVESSAA